VYATIIRLVSITVVFSFTYHVMFYIVYDTQRLRFVSCLINQWLIDWLTDWVRIISSSVVCSPGRLVYGMGECWMLNREKLAVADYVPKTSCWKLTLWYSVNKWMNVPINERKNVSINQSINQINQINKN